jgi:hypothetical protein
LVGTTHILVDDVSQHLVVGRGGVGADEATRPQSPIEHGIQFRGIEGE